MHHGSTDAPTVDVVEVLEGAGTIVNDIAYGQFAGYLELTTSNYQLEIRDETGEITVATFNAQLADLALQGKALAVIASGFLNPANNSNGAAFGLYAVLPTGGPFIELGNTSSVEENIIITESISTYPNPATDQLNVAFSLKKAAEVNYSVFTASGKMVRSGNSGFLNETNQNLSINVADLPTGLYIVTLNSENSQAAAKVQIIK